MEKYHENKTPRDEEYVGAYLKYRSQLKAAKECGVGRETVARAVRRAGIKLTGHSDSGNHGGGTAPKITDVELIEEAKTMSRAEIARKHGMNICNVDRKIRRLGIKCICGKGTGGHYRERAYSYGVKEFDESINLKDVYAKFGGVCQICGKKTDWESIDGRHIKRDYPTVDHIMPLSRGGTHTWDNIQLACMSCNAGKCDR